jgi:hypothetical protein
VTKRSWRVDAAYLRVAGKWTYLYRAVDSTGDTVDFLLSTERDIFMLSVTGGNERTVEHHRTLVASAGSIEAHDSRVR